MTTSACGGSACIEGVSRDCGHGMFWLEGGATRSQTRRDTNFAIPGYLLFSMIPRRTVKIKIFLSVVIYVVKAAFCAAFSNRGKSRERRCRKALRRFALPCPGYRHGTPKASALPTALIPDMKFRLIRRPVCSTAFFSYAASFSGNCCQYTTYNSSVQTNPQKQTAIL